MYINESVGLLDIIINVLYYVLDFIILMSIILLFAFGIPALIRNIYDYSVYNRTFIIPYEREIVKKTLLTYNNDYKFLWLHFNFIQMNIVSHVLKMICGFLSSVPNATP